MVINYLAIFVVSMAFYLFGWLWYSPVLFGKQWMKLSGVKMPKKGEPMAGKMLMGFIATLITVWILEMVIQLLSASTFIAGLMIGFWAWLGFIATTTIGSYLWEGKPFKLWVLNNTYNLLYIALAAGFLAIWP